MYISMEENHWGPLDQLCKENIYFHEDGLKLLIPSPSTLPFFFFNSFIPSLFIFFSLYIIRIKNKNKIMEELRVSVIEKSFKRLLFDLLTADYRVYRDIR